MNKSRLKERLRDQKTCSLLKKKKRRKRNVVANKISILGKKRRRGKNNPINFNFNPNEMNNK